jgi:hypothetical protein
MQREVLNLTQSLGQMGQSDAAIRLGQAFETLSQKLEDGTASGDDARAALEILNSVTGYAKPLVESLAGALGILAGRLDSAAGSAANLAEQADRALASSNKLNNLEGLAKAGRIYKDRIAAGESVIENQERMNGLSAEQLDLENETNRLVDEGVVSRTEAARLAGETIAAERRRAAEAKAERSSSSGGGGGGGGRASAAKSVDREREAVTKLIEQLQFEQSLLGLTNEQKQIQTALRRAGAEATDAERSQIEQIVSATYAQTEALQAQEDQLERVKSLSKDVLSGIAEDLRDGVSGAQLLANALNRVAEAFINAGIEQLINSTFKGGAGGGGFFGGRIIPGILHSGGKAGVDGYGHSRVFPASTWNGARRFHTGGVVGGLRAGEVPAILQKGETVIPRGGQGNGSVDVRVGVDQSGNLQAFIVRTSGAVAAQVVKQTAPGVVANAQIRGR